MKRNHVWVVEVRCKLADWRPTVKHYDTEEEAEMGAQTMNEITPTASGFEYRHTKYTAEQSTGGS